ncbi:hypothetical protein HGP14_34100 [Rhizobium sp. P32RR-XVIII]|uniref:hypothetical protein n=1 Tax=Rhizobium sp. P32RR-XVIII TaxID=2726738 RepID=UPI0014563D3F|nr:hypothetical protein [Rhizobium sp. P32RR-XVIII]NLS08226.1 hypothetical protein [Rhizobium sp. P32RR-XVIII]
MSFPRPRSENPSLRFEDAKSAVRNILQELLASANEAGWGTEEITVAIVEAAQVLKEANNKDSDPADDPSISNAATEQIGRGELYD